MTTRITVLGPGCARCHELFENAKAAVDDLGIKAEVRKVEDVAEMVSRGILASPALLVNDELVLAGHVATSRRIGELITASL